MRDLPDAKRREALLPLVLLLLLLRKIASASDIWTVRKVLFIFPCINLVRSLIGKTHLPGSDTGSLIEVCHLYVTACNEGYHYSWNLSCATKQGNWVSGLVRAGFAAFGKGVQLISEPPYAEVEKLSLLTALCVILSTKWWLVTNVRLRLQGGRLCLLQRRITHWWAASHYQKQRNRSELTNWIDYLALWDTLSFTFHIKSYCRPLHLIKLPTLLI